MANRLIRLPSSEDLNSHFPQRHWVNKVTKEQEYLFEDGAIFGPEVRPVLYNQYSTQWILKHGNHSFISVHELDYQPAKFAPSADGTPLSLWDVIFWATESLTTPQYEPIEPEAYGGRKAQLMDLRKWRPFNFDLDKWSKWVRYPLPKGYLDRLNKAHHPHYVWTDDFSNVKTEFNDYFDFSFRPVVRQCFLRSAPVSQAVMVAFHVYEKAFYFHKSGTDYDHLAKILHKESKKSLSLEELWQWLRDYCWKDRELENDQSDFALEDMDDVDYESPEQCSWQVLTPWFEEPKYLLPGDDRVDDWKEWMGQQVWLSSSNSDSGYGSGSSRPSQSDPSSQASDRTSDTSSVFSVATRPVNQGRKAMLKGPLPDLRAHEMATARARASSPYRQTNTLNLPEDIGHPASKPAPSPVANKPKTPKEEPPAESSQSTQDRRKKTPKTRRK